MQHFPVSSSILAPDHIAQFVSNTHQLNGHTTCRILKTGINHNYLIEHQEEKYVFRVYFKDWRTKLEIEEELALLKALQAFGMKVSYPLEDKEGKTIHELRSPEGIRYAVLFTYAKGESIRNPSVKTCYQLGKQIAQMHTYTHNKTLQRKDYNANSLINWAYERATKQFGTASRAMQYFQAAANSVTQAFASITDKNVRNGIVHLDLWCENMRVENETDITFFDFDNCGNGPLFLDLSYSLMLIFKNEPNKTAFEQKRQALLEGYQSLHKLTEHERKLIPFGGLAIWLHYTGVHLERFNDFANHFMSADFLNFWIHTVEVWMKYNNIYILPEEV